ncbi:MAG: hypothetical protein HN707_12670 [Verrucomicrobia bacterium]|jgi:hypothetical protein|nr:hypothetical protein [Verrucomicrobiota bacterium]MBT3913153.1 hypothetical protein [Verrucomicrobiota bacterium]MBT4227518.1 hypothetical protein [Verrucomicrobiota bacterium]MBT4901715.1 hypothetical protein [Verrucomicrobiota bacterium]MBT5311787.1 hypothetical protein [Verrucomicrobiota bacterium]
MAHKLKAHFLALSLGLLLTGCGEVTEEALQANTSEESAGDLITYFETADPKLKQLAKIASDALDKANFPLAIQSINQLKANGAQLTVDQFMVVSEAGVNVQSAMIEAAENGDKKAQQLLNLQSAGRRN